MNRTDIRIIGLGSPHGDDQVGWRVIEDLRRADINAGLLALDRPGPALLNDLGDCRRVILIDACDGGWQGGEIRHLTLAQLLNGAELQQQSSHQLGLAETLQLAKITGHRLPEIDCYLIQLTDASPLAEISPVVAHAGRQLAALIAAQFGSSDSG